MWPVLWSIILIISGPQICVDIGGYGEYGRIQRNTAGYGGTAGYSGIQLDTVGYSGIEWDTTEYRGIQRDTMGCIKKRLQSTGMCSMCSR